MTLMRFLAAGRSLSSVDTAPSRYRVNAQGLLPRFGKDASASPAASSAPAPQEEHEKTLSDRKLSGHSIAAQSQQSQRSGGARFWNWARLFGSKRGAARASGRPVQAELALDMVRPVRNDLSDSDFDVVPAPRQVARPTASANAGPATVQGADAGAKLPGGRVKTWFGVRQS